MFQLGTNVSKKTLDLYLLREDVKGNVKTRKLQNDISAVNAVIAWLSKQYCKPEDIHIIMEATGVYCESLVYGLHEAGGRISLISPHRAREFAWNVEMLTKNDRVDAYILACYGVFKASEPWSFPPEEVRHLSALLCRRDTLMADSTHGKNRLEKYLVTNTSPVIVESIEAMIGQLNAEIKRLNRLIRSHLNQHPELKKDFDLPMSIRSAGYQLSLNMLAVLRSHDFVTTEQAAVFLGVVPVEKYSGAPVRGCLKPSRIGPPEIRAKLYLASLCGLRFDPSMKAMYERLYLRGRGKMYAIGALMRKPVHWRYGVLRIQKPFDMDCPPPYVRSACKAAWRSCMWYRSNAAEARRKPVRISRLHLSHPYPTKPCGLLAMMKYRQALLTPLTRPRRVVSGT